MRLRPHLTIAAMLALASVSTAASAQDWTLDTSALGASAQPKGKKARPQSAAAADRGAPNPKAPPNAKGENRQFGELEGWSPGKSPPKPKDKQDDSPRFGKAPVNMNSNGGMGVGMPF